MSVDIKQVTPEWIRSHIPHTVFKADKDNYAIIADAMEALLKQIEKMKNGIL